MPIYGRDAGRLWLWSEAHAGLCDLTMPRAHPCVYKRPTSGPWLTAHKFHLLTGWLAQPRWYPCPEHLGQFHPAPWPDTDAAAAKAGADAAAGDGDVAAEGGAAVGGGGGEVKGVPLRAQESDGWAEPPVLPTLKCPLLLSSVLPPLHRCEVQTKIRC